MIKITEDMQQAANRESKRRTEYIQHHFEVSHFTKQERDAVGFLGEFAACQFLGIDWRKNIRQNYLTIDTGDIILNDSVIDVKTETLPAGKLRKIVNGRILDDETYGRRLINKNQVELLTQYDFVLFGGFIRGNLNEWYPFGYVETDYILNNYEVTTKRPDGGYYPEAAMPVRTSSLKDAKNLLTVD